MVKTGQIWKSKRDKTYYFITCASDNWFHEVTVLGLDIETKTFLCIRPNEEDVLLFRDVP